MSALPANGQVAISGERCAQSAPLDFLVVGFNLVGVPFAAQAGGHDAQTLANAIVAAGGVVDSVQRWGVAGAQGFDGWLPGSAGPFAIEDIAAYFIKLSKVPVIPVSP